MQTVIGDNLHEIVSNQSTLRDAASRITLKREDVFNDDSNVPSADKWYDANLQGVFRQLLAHGK